MFMVRVEERKTNKIIAEDPLQNVVDAENLKFIYEFQYNPKEYEVYIERE